MNGYYFFNQLYCWVDMINGFPFSPLIFRLFTIVAWYLEPLWIMARCDVVHLPSAGRFPPSTPKASWRTGTFTWPQFRPAHTMSPWRSCRTVRTILVSVHAAGVFNSLILLKGTCPLNRMTIYHAFRQQLTTRCDVGEKVQEKWKLFGSDTKLGSVINFKAGLNYSHLVVLERLPNKNLCYIIAY